MFEAQREACIAAAQAGGKVLLSYFRKLDPASVKEKARYDFVTEADQASEAAVKDELDRRFPQYSYLGEELGSFGENARCWIVDPLDGTLNFVHGFPHWCVSVALWDAEGPVVGCIYDPLRDDMFVAVRGEGATWSGQAMSISQQGGLDGAFLATGFAFQLGERFHDYNRALSAVFFRARGLRRPGSAALDLAHVACGIFDGYFEMGLKKWDMAAGVLLVTEAGGLVTDWKGGNRWFDTGDIVAGNLWVHQDLIDVLRS
jgi:myo-inositol-1(or 4)-monophosphatase